MADFRGKTQPGVGTGRHAAAAAGLCHVGTAAAGQLEVVRPWPWKNGNLTECDANAAHVNRELTAGSNTRLSCSCKLSFHTQGQK